MKLALCAALAAAAAFAAAADAQPRRARCVITGEQNRVLFSGPCLFSAGPGGSFHLRPVRGRALVGETTDLTVTVLRPGVADVRGLTVRGINSRWGEARRSRRDRACWAGEGFSVCAY